jgi:hypothetical protein
MLQMPRIAAARRAFSLNFLITHRDVYSSQRHRIEERRGQLVQRDDEHNGAPPHIAVDLDGRTFPGAAPTSEYVVQAS